MPEAWIRCKRTAEFLSDAHPGSGSGGSGTDALVARDRYNCPVIWASRVECVLRDAAHAILRKLSDETLQPKERALHAARLFIRRLRAAMRSR